MGLCQLCNEREATKTNTHYLTDGIIRNCLNQDGSTNREKGAFFDMSNTSASTEFGFQRGTSPEKIEEVLGRSPSDDEIEKAKEVPFSVDRKFCPTCEDKFTYIESEFIKAILPKFRGVDLSDKISITLTGQDANLAKAFFLLQVWRSHICRDDFEINEESAEELRNYILDFEETGGTPEYPMSIKYLYTEGGIERLTENLVGITSDRNPNVIFMCDFIIQFFDDADEVCIDEFYGLNKEKRIEEYISTTDQGFVIKIIGNEDRLRFLMEIMRQEKTVPMMKELAEFFIRICNGAFGFQPEKEEVEEYVRHMATSDSDALAKFTKEQILQRTAEYIKEKLSR